MYSTIGMHTQTKSDQISHSGNGRDVTSATEVLVLCMMYANHYNKNDVSCIVESLRTAIKSSEKGAGDTLMITLFREVYNSTPCPDLKKNNNDKSNKTIKYGRFEGGCLVRTIKNGNGTKRTFPMSPQSIHTIPPRTTMSSSEP